MTFTMDDLLNAVNAQNFQSVAELNAAFANLKAISDSDIPDPSWLTKTLKRLWKIDYKLTLQTKLSIAMNSAEQAANAARQQYNDEINQTNADIAATDQEIATLQMQG